MGWRRFCRVERVAALGICQPCKGRESCKERVLVWYRRVRVWLSWLGEGSGRRRGIKNKLKWDRVWYLMSNN